MYAPNSFATRAFHRSICKGLIIRTCSQPSRIRRLSQWDPFPLSAVSRNHASGTILQFHFQSHPAKASQRDLGFDGLSVDGEFGSLEVCDGHASSSDSFNQHGLLLGRLLLTRMLLLHFDYLSQSQDDEAQDRFADYCAQLVVVLRSPGMPLEVRGPSCVAVSVELLSLDIWKVI